eukprot:Skav226659  [mRNA]  locus=scaffold2733:226437:229979:+ [translate_table: standard]
MDAYIFDLAETFEERLAEIIETKKRIASYVCSEARLKGSKGFISPADVRFGSIPISSKTLVLARATPLDAMGSKATVAKFCLLVLTLLRIAANFYWGLSVSKYYSWNVSVLKDWTNCPCDGPCTDPNLDPGAWCNYSASSFNDYWYMVDLPRGDYSGCDEVNVTWGYCWNPPFDPDRAFHSKTLRLNEMRTTDLHRYYSDHPRFYAYEIRIDFMALMNYAVKPLISALGVFIFLSRQRSSAASRLHLWCFCSVLWIFVSSPLADESIAGLQLEITGTRDEMWVNGLGQHVTNPESLNGDCYCKALYGSVPWQAYVSEVDLTDPDCPIDQEQLAFKKADAKAMGQMLLIKYSHTTRLEWNAKKSQAMQKAHECWQQNQGRAPWGCAWFHLWKGNVNAAVEKDQSLHVFYFEGRVGAGKLSWDELGDEESRRTAREGGGLGEKHITEMGNAELQEFFALKP